MTEKELFVSEIQSLLDTNQLQLSDASLAYFEAMKVTKTQISCPNMMLESPFPQKKLLRGWASLLVPCLAR